MTAHDGPTGDASTGDRGDLFIVITMDEAEQIITAARHDGTAAEVIDALVTLVERASKWGRP